MSSQSGSQKLLQGLVSHELTAYLFKLFKLNELWQYYQKHVNQIIFNHTTLWSLALQIFQAFIWILLIPNLSLTWLNWFWQFLCDRLSSFNSKGFYYSHVWFLLYRTYLFCTGLISRKLCRFLLMFSTGFTLLSALLLFPLSITFFVFVHGFWFYFIQYRWGSLNQPIC